MTTRTRTATIAASVLLGSLGLTSVASASDATVKAASEAHAGQFHALAGQQAKAFGRWTKAGHSKKTSKPVLRALKAADKLDHAQTREIRAQAPSTQTGAQAKQYALLANASYSHYLTSLEKAVHLATAGKIAKANKQITLATGYAKQSARQHDAARQLFAQTS